MGLDDLFDSDTDRSSKPITMYQWEENSEVSKLWLQFVGVAF